MGVVTVAGPKGDLQFEVDGDKPTQAEFAEIDRILYPEQYQARGSITKSPVSGATLEEVREYSRMRKQAGITPSGDKMTPEEYASVYREEGVDYTTGLQDVGKFSRFGFGRMETDEGRANYLRRAVGEGGFRQDALNRFLLTKQGRKTLGMEEGAELSIDEEGLSFGDLKEFLGQSGLPLAAGIGAGLIASGIGVIPGVLIAGAAAGGAKLLDEGIEYAQGLQDQTFNGVMTDAAVEAVFSGGGEFGGRVVSKVIGRLLKGKGGVLGEAERAKVIAALDAGAKPTMAGVTSPDFRQGFKIMQAFSEAVFPNAAAARTNLGVVLKQIEELRIVDSDRLDDLGSALEKDIQIRFSTSSEKLLDAQKYMDDVVSKDLNKAAASLRKDGVIPKNLVEMIQLRKTVFDQTYDSLVDDPLNALNGQKFISTAGLKSELKRLIDESPADVKSSNFAKQIKSLPKYVEYKDISKIRTGLSEVMKDPQIVNGASVGALSALKNALTTSLEDAEVQLIKASTSPTSKGGKVLNLAGVTAEFGDLGEALGFMRRANSLYRNAMRRFDNLTTINMVKAAQNNRLNEAYVLTEILKPDNPEILEQLLKAVRGAKFVEGLPLGARTVRRQLINGKTLEQARAEMAIAPEKSALRRSLMQKIRFAENKASQVQTASKIGAQEAERLRKSFATMYLDDVIKQSTESSNELTGLSRIDPVKFVENFRKLGSTNKVLFKNEMKDLEDLFFVMEREKSELAPSILREAFTKNPTLAGAMAEVKAAVIEKSALSKSQFFRVLQEGDPEEVAKQVLKSRRNTAEALKTLSPDTMEAVRDAAMLRILRQVDIVPDRVGKVVPSDDLMQGFESGRLGGRFLNVLNAYDKETLDALFGPGAANGLQKLAQNMTQLSNAAIKGKGSIVAAGVAATMASFGYLLSPIAVLAPLAKFFVLSKILREPSLLRTLSRSRDKNTLRQLMQGTLSTKDPLAQAFQIINQLASQAAVQGGRGLGEQAEEETNALQQLSSKKVQEGQQTDEASKMLSDLRKIGGAAVGMVTNPMGTQSANTTPAPARPPISSILVPNPSTRATFGQ